MIKPKFDSWLNTLVFGRSDNETEVFINCLKANPNSIGVTATKYLKNILKKKVSNKIICLDDVDEVKSGPNSFIFHRDANSILLIE